MAEIRNLSEIEPKVFSKKGLFNEEALSQEIKDVDVIVTDGPAYRFTGKILKAARRLKLIAIYGPASGAEHVNVDVATNEGVIVIHTPFPTAIAVHAIGLMISLAKKIVDANNSLKSGLWEREEFCGSTLDGKTLGLIGCGQIGTKVAEIANALDMKVLIYDPYVEPEKLKRAGKSIDLETLLKEADFISIHVPLTAETNKMISEKELDMMKKSAYLINTSRGSVINQQALCKALIDCRIAGAGLDVFDAEPVKPDDPLLKLPNVVVTPHIAGYEIERYRRQSMIIAEEISRVLAGEMPRNLANPEVLRKPHRLSSWLERGEPLA